MSLFYVSYNSLNTLIKENNLLYLYVPSIAFCKRIIEITKLHLSRGIRGFQASKPSQNQILLGALNLNVKKSQVSSGKFGK